MSKYYLGIDTSNYTTSVCAYNRDKNIVISKRKLLPVKDGARGLRQSDAVFHHTQQLPGLIENLYEDISFDFSAVSVSSRPRNVEGSYMPCFTVGVAAAKIISKTNKIPLYEFSHQQGHIAAALYSSNRLDLIDRTHIAFHISGGTTEALLVNSSEEFLSTKLIAKTLDLNAGQLIDRVGVMLGLQFPCGKDLEKLALDCNDEISVNPVLKDFDCCLSGGENLCQKLLKDGKSKEHIAKFCLKYVENAIFKMSEKLARKYPNLPIIYAGGVMSNSIIKNSLSNNFDCVFAKPEFSTDNAAGVAVLAYYADNCF